MRGVGDEKFWHTDPRRSFVTSPRPAHLFQCGEGAACGNLHALAAIHDPLQHGLNDVVEQLWSARDDPGGVSADGPAGDASHQRVLVAQAVEEEGHELGEVLGHASETAFGNGPQRQNPALLAHPVVVGQDLTQERDKLRQHLILQILANIVKRGRRAFPCMSKVKQMPERVRGRVDGVDEGRWGESQGTCGGSQGSGIKQKDRFAVQISLT